ncbi:MAG: ATP-binding cassette domain-containing protein, partial [Bdellovibrionota bacterium]
MLKVESFSKSFKNTDAVTSLSFTVLPGEVLGLLGPNGSGKTTTLRAVTGLIRPDSGRIFVGQFDVQNSPIEAKRQLGFLSDQPAFFDSLTCWENICLLAKIYSTTNWESRAKALFEKFELADKRDSYPSELSKGLKQRLGLIGVLLHNPKLLLL